MPLRRGYPERRAWRSIPAEQPYRETRSAAAFLPFPERRVSCWAYKAEHNGKNSAHTPKDLQTSASLKVSVLRCVWWPHTWLLREYFFSFEIRFIFLYLSPALSRFISRFLLYGRGKREKGRQCHGILTNFYKIDFKRAALKSIFAALVASQIISSFQTSVKLRFFSLSLNLKEKKSRQSLNDIICKYVL